MIFVGNVVLKMGLPVLMADNEGFRKVLADRKSCTHCCCCGYYGIPPRAQICCGLLLRHREPDLEDDESADDALHGRRG